jgi:DNA replicative helicase MCM subunit Mcm2 (Cdc46/Mcm family)
MEQEKNDEDQKMEDVNNQDDEAGVQDQLLKDDHEHLFNDRQVQHFKDFGKDPELYEKLIDAFAPSIWENTDVKKGILC